MTQLRIDLIDTLNERRLTIKLPDDVPLEQLVPALARKLGLPEGDYALTVEETGASLTAGVTLASAGIAEGEALQLQAKVMKRERPEPATLRLSLVDTVKDRRLTVNLPDDAPLAQLVQALARKLGLPEGDYALTVEGAKAPLAAALTLSEAGVRGGEVLKLQIPLAAEDYLGRGIAHVEQGRYQQAIADFNRALQIKPDNAAAYINLGHTHMEMGQYQQAMADFDRAIEIEPDNALAHLARGSVHRMLGQYQRAIADLNWVIQIEPDNALAHFGRGNSYLSLGRYQQAIADFNKAIQIEPYNAEAYISRGLAHYNLDRHKQAIADYDKAIGIEPDDAKAYYGRGVAYTKLGQPERARADLERAFELNPALKPEGWE
jgi:tetratricopeptide (TPR) repeat protein